MKLACLGFRVRTPLAAESEDWNDFVAKGVVPSNAEAAIKDKVRFR
ncbi:MAG: hypothetical protein IOC90_09175 [Methylocystis sp.]|nr:hypothetical protein [Methylocystis sp.]MCA3582294.1 hypothetical protein [Methylocystis sp.]MCA3588189.1 hypothetical protein [Methylocystis sp.]MCA3590107.1 hypothetical protein [Methylocystis sp.]